MLVLKTQEKVNLRLCFVLVFVCFLKITYDIVFHVHSCFICLKKKSGIDKSTEWSMIPACPSLFYRGDTDGTNSSKILCSMFVTVLFHVNLCRD